MNENKEPILPSSQVMQYALKLAISKDKPILLDYWIDSLESKAILGQKNNDTKDKLLVKSAEEFTSTIENIYSPKNTNELIVITENSIYIVSNKIQKRVVS
jgi:hypothetical protein